MSAKGRKKQFLWFITFAIVVFVLRVNVFAQATPEYGTYRNYDNPSGVVSDTSQNPSIRLVKVIIDILGLVFFVLLIGVTLYAPIFTLRLARRYKAIERQIDKDKENAVNDATSKQKNQQQDEALNNLRSEIEKIKDNIDKINTEIGKLWSEIKELRFLTNQSEKLLDLQRSIENVKGLSEAGDIMQSVQSLQQSFEELRRLVMKNDEKSLDDTLKGRQRPKRVKKDSKGKEKKDDKSST